LAEALILVDSSIWAEHIGRPVPRLAELLLQEKVLGHPYVLGEILLGNLKDRRSFEVDYLDLVTAEKAEDQEVLRMIAEHGLFGTGIGYVDAHLLASAFLTNCQLLTRDKRLAVVALRMGIGEAF
jgi:predicted nucleic acid-binding protein